MKIKNLVKRYHILCSLLRDIGLGALAFVAAYWVNRGSMVTLPSLRLLWVYFFICILSTVASMALLKSYRVEWRYAGITEIVNVVLAFIVSGVIATILKISYFSKVYLNLLFLSIFSILDFPYCGGCRQGLRSS